MLNILFYLLKVCKESKVILWKMILLITNLAYGKLIMKILQSSFIHKFIHFTYEYHVLKTCLTHG
jgi:hypothetical protein